jgi:hypothetical protein
MSTLTDRLRQHARMIVTLARHFSGEDLPPSALERQQAADLCEAADAIDAARWKPIETAPRDTEVLVWFGPQVGVKSATYTSPWTDEVLMWCVDDKKFDPHPVRQYCLPYPTHWRPLPAPPEGEAT